MPKKKKVVLITTASLVIIICCISLGYLVIHFCHYLNSLIPYNHQRHYFESSDNAILTQALSGEDNAGKKENFYIMAMPMTMVSVSKSKVLSFESGEASKVKTSTSFSKTSSKITFKNAMLLTYQGMQYKAREISYSKFSPKMKITFFDSNNTAIGTAIFTRTT